MTRKLRLDVGIKRQYQVIYPEFQQPFSWQSRCVSCTIREHVVGIGTLTLEEKVIRENDHVINLFQNFDQEKSIISLPEYSRLKCLQVYYDLIQL